MHLALLDPTSFVRSSGYAAIFVLAILQSLGVPTSSELTMGFAGVLAGSGELSLPGAIAVGVTGEVLGAYLGWWVGRAGARPVVERYGRWVLLSPRDLDRAEGWFLRHRRWGVFASRLVPVVRGYVAYPAGAARVPALRFGLLTLLGSAVWDGAMALIGYGISSHWRAVMHGFSAAGYVIGAALVILVAAGIAHRWRAYRRATVEVAEVAEVVEVPAVPQRPEGR